jgi:hypothetical protein
MATCSLYPEPIKGVPIVEPETIPEPGQVIIGYELVPPLPPPKGLKQLFHKPEPRRMNTAGVLGVLALLLCFWPCAAVPCFTACSYDQCQRPVYGTHGRGHKHTTSTPV